MALRIENSVASRRGDPMDDAHAYQCPACAAGNLERFLDLPAVPLISTAFPVDRALALSTPRGDLRLGLCRDCGLVWNLAFEADRVTYTPEYENSQHFSALFRAFADDLADRLGSTYRLEGRTVVEIGCGKGEFLALLCARAGSRGLGFDPTFAGEVAPDGIEVVRDYYGPTTGAHLEAQLVLARHVLEHLADPVEFLRTIRSTAGVETPLYLEVPNAESVFSPAGMWDLLYQHVAYFSRPALLAVVRRGGYEVTDLRTAFHGQFLSVEGRPAPLAVGQPPDPEAVAGVCAVVEGFADRLQSRLAHWRDRLTAAGGEVVLWGAGARGVAFLNLLDAEGAVQRVVDVNPRKVGRFVPGTGHRIDTTSSVADASVATVLITNPAYRAEISEEVASLGSLATVEVV